jgi:hypothetical protein
MLNKGIVKDGGGSAALTTRHLFINNCGTKNMPISGGRPVGIVRLWAKSPCTELIKH